MSLAENLRALLKRKKLDQKTLAKKAGVPANNVSDWVTGKSFPRPGNLQKLASALDTTVARLLA